MIHIATVSSALMPRIVEGNLIEPGQWVSEVWVSMRAAKASGDPKGYVQHEIAVHLAGCVKNTEIPLNEKMWNVAFTRFAQVNFNFPAGFTT